MTRRLRSLVAALLLATAGPATALEVRDPESGRSAEAVPAEAALAGILLRDTAGRVIARFALRPAAEARFGLRGVDAIRWVGRDRIAVSGTANPSTVETVILDARTGREIDSIFSNGRGAVFSADGRHVAYIDGEPHFAAAASYESTLKVDHVAVFPVAGRRVAFVADPVFSADGRSLAFAYAPRTASGRPLGVSLAIWRAGRGIVADRPYGDATAVDGVVLSAVGGGFAATLPGEIAGVLLSE